MGCLTRYGVLKAFDFSGKEIWSRDLQKEYGRFGLNWGYASSPLLKSNALYVQVLHGMKTDDPSYVMKIDTVTGKTLWRIERATPAVFESPDFVASPTIVNNLIIAPTRISPLVAMRPGGHGNVAKTHVAWTFNQGPDVPTRLFCGRSGRGNPDHRPIRP